MPSHISPVARRQYHREYMRQQYRDNAEHRAKQKARAAVGHALRDGRLEKTPCTQCGAAISEAHHPDYANMLGVEWLCRQCHKATHAIQDAAGTTPAGKDSRGEHGT